MLDERLTAPPFDALPRTDAPLRMDRPPFLSRSSLLTAPYPHPPEHRATRWVIRATLLAFGRRVRGVTGIDRLRGMTGPFVTVLNHSQRLEAFLVPALLAWLRGGRIVRFLADWNFMLLPPVYLLYRSARVIPVATKPARPRFLTPLRRLLAPAPNGFDEARTCLARGQAVGLFPEGTTNRNPERLLHGRGGAARLAADADVPVLPIGIRFPDHSDPDRSIGDGEPLSIHVGTPLAPPGRASAAARSSGGDGWHAVIMRALADQSDTTWDPDRSRSAVAG
jgi:1-acyl-sn-glycerol-3-phosphate acyltransferase